MEKTPDRLKNGEQGVVLHWVNQPGYAGMRIKKSRDKLTLIDANGFESMHVDMRFPHHCLVKIWEE